MACQRNLSRAIPLIIFIGMAGAKLIGAYLLLLLAIVLMGGFLVSGL
jgi:hypothetical protein